MLDIADKVDGSTTLPAAEFNSLKNELENAIEATGQTLSGADEFQISKSMANYASVGDFYTGGGSSNAYTLSAVSPRNIPTAYFAGMRVRFIAPFTNTGACTANLGGLGAVNIKLAGTIDPYAGAIQSGDLIDLIHDGTNLILPDYILQNINFNYRKTNDATAVSSGATVRTVLLFDDVEKDIGSFYNTGTGRYQPTVPGEYEFFLNGDVGVNAAGSAGILIALNGTTDADILVESNFTVTAATSRALSIYTRVALNGTTDYVQFVVGASSGTLTATFKGTATTGKWYPTAGGGLISR